MRALNRLLIGMTLILFLTLPETSMVFGQSASLTTTIHLTVMPIPGYNVPMENMSEQDIDEMQTAMPKAEKIIRGGKEITLYTFCSAL